MANTHPLVSVNEAPCLSPPRCDRLLTFGDAPGPPGTGPFVPDPQLPSGLQRERTVQARAFSAARPGQVWPRVPGSTALPCQGFRSLGRGAKPGWRGRE